MPSDRSESTDAFVRGVRTVLGPVASLKITVVLFLFSILLVFFGTLAQKGQGIWTVVESYFYSGWVKVELQYLLEFGKIFTPFAVSPSATTSAWFPLPGGKTIGWLMFFNLLFAHTLQLVNLIDGVRKQAARTRSTAGEVLLVLTKRSGIYVLHAGILLMLIGEWITREYAVEQQMLVMTGGSANYAVETRNYELAVIDRTDPATDKVTVVPAKKLQALKEGQRLSHPELPFDVEVKAYYSNSAVLRKGHAGAPAENPATEGEGKEWIAAGRPEVSGVDMSQKTDMPSAYLTLYKKGGSEAIGTFLVSSGIDELQPVPGTPHVIQLRNARHYKPFELHLLEFRFDRYLGTETARNYSSRVRLMDPERGQDREYVISMNDPLRHRGETFYQSSFTPDEKGTILQVVDNWGWWVPYISCVLVTLGMLIHFGIKLVTFLSRAFSGKLAQNAVSAARSSVVDLTGRTESLWLKLLPPVAGVAFAAMTLSSAFLPKHPTKDRLDLQQVATLPVVDGGRVKPLDTVARVDLRLITFREEYKDQAGNMQPAIRWFLDAATSDPQAADDPSTKLEIFRIENDQVRELLKLQRREGLRYSIHEMKAEFEALDREAKKARDVPDKDRDLYQQKVLELRRHVELYLEVAFGHSPLVLPPDGDKNWRRAADAERDARTSTVERLRPAMMKALADAGIPLNPDDMTAEQQKRAAQIITDIRASAPPPDRALTAWNELLRTYKAGDQQQFDKAVLEYRKIVDGAVPESDRGRVNFEVYMNQAAVFYWCIYAYVLAAVAALLGFACLIFAPKAGSVFRRGAFWLLLATLLVHTFALIGRMYLSGRWGVFVTNLYSSAVFIGWGVVLIGLLAEVVYPIGIGNLVAAVLGAATTFVAHNLAVSGGDTLEMMQAVLDTNFWLATHVTTVTFGYSATYVAGAIGLGYVILYLFPEAMVLRQRVTIGSGVHAITTDVGKILGQLLYAVVCFATLLSFVGTVLGGIWADQSWGRFWGWDPKENGAVLIVVWNALILHARWAGLVKERGMAVLSLVGIMITTWSWFGTNQLGVGLHAYGFNNQLVTLCDGVWAGSMFAILVGVLPWQWVYRGSAAAGAALVPEAGQTSPPRAHRV
jgi:ABC-type transport system involved in cytochrome c biogenesis permease subunit